MQNDCRCGAGCEDCVRCEFPQCECYCDLMDGSDDDELEEDDY